ncbi:FRG domain-containing protein [Vibrio harveyi]|uniref:FRG domain-containing protein n=1 Tax=Vibrio harveyi TaxID=669 RepID=UPI003BB645F3
MKEFEVSSLDEFVRVTGDNFQYGHLFRGVEDVEHHKLIPSVGRYFEKYKEKGFTKTDFLKDEQDSFRVFYKEARNRTNANNYWEWLAIAQHHGLATRLLDWSFNPLISLYFAISRNVDADSCVYVVDQNIKFISTSEEESLDPFRVKEVRAYLPTHVTDRIRAQSGLFTIQPDPSIALDEYIVGKIIIKKDSKQTMKHRLGLMGVHQKSVFPDLDGLSGWIRWMKFDSLEY